MALPHCSPPRVPEWQLSAWPERDPDCEVSQAHQHTSFKEEDEALDRACRQQGMPLPHKPANTDRYLLERNNQRMLATMTADTPTIDYNCSPVQLMQDRRDAFEMFQHVWQGVNMMYVFDLEQAFAVAGHKDVDDAHLAQLRRNFNLTPGDRMTLEQFVAMCDLLEVMPASPPREREEIAPMPGSPDYVSGKPEKEKKVAAAAKPKNAVPYHVQMSKRVELPDTVRAQINNASA